MSGVQSICHPFATVIFKIITEQRKGSEHAEQSADSINGVACVCLKL